MDPGCASAMGAYLETPAFFLVRFLPAFLLRPIVYYPTRNYTGVSRYQGALSGV